MYSSMYVLLYCVLHFLQLFLHAESLKVLTKDVAACTTCGIAQIFFATRIVGCTTKYISKYFEVHTTRSTT